MAVVYQGVDDRLDRQVAIKVLRADLAADPGLRSRFEAEARSAARLVHPNVVSVFDTGESGGRPYIVMERLSGETLADLIRTGPLGEAQVTRMGAEVLAALSMAHGAGIIHRDIKPGNILVAGNGSVKVADFGIAKGLEPRQGQSTDLTATAMLIGTPAYLAPERLAGQPATVACDLWAVGAVIYEALAGVKPFAGATPLAVAGAIQHTDPLPLAEHRPDLSPAVIATVTRVLARRPEDRFGSATQMADALAGGGLAAAATAASPGVGGIDPTVVLPDDPVADPTSVLPGLPGLARASTVASREDRRAVGSPGRPDIPSRQSRRSRAFVIAVLVLAALGAVVAIALPSANSPPHAPTSPSSTSVAQTTIPTEATPPTAHRTVPSATNDVTTTSQAPTSPPATTTSAPTTTLPTTGAPGPTNTTPPTGPGNHDKGPGHGAGKAR